MATTITAGNATNGLTLTPDNTGALELKTGTGAGTTALTLDSSQNATVAGTLKAAGVTTAMYPLVSGTAVASTSGTSVDFTGIPSWVKRITIVFQGVSLSGADNLLVQIGSGSLTTTGYISTGNSLSQANATAGTNNTTGFVISAPGAAGLVSGHMVISTIGSNIWVASHVVKISTTNMNLGAGDVTLSGALDRVSITRTGTNTFDAGSINILYE